jgi:hypothetical protein
VSQDPIIAWLTAFDRLLPLRGRARWRVRAELEAHLMDAADEAAGRNAADPAAEAVQRMGDPAVVAHEFGSGRRTLAVIALLLWLPAAVAVTVGVGAAYAIGQQVLRSDANDPQVQIAEDAAAALTNGASPHAVVNGPTVDLAHSLGTSVTVLDPSDHVAASSAMLNGRVPLPPSGALRAADGGDANTVTWQPQAGVRQAAVIVSYHGRSGAGTVLVSRSLRLVEERENALLLLSMVGWLASLLVAAVLALVSASYWTSTRGPRPGAPVWASA